MKKIMIGLTLLLFMGCGKEFKNDINFTGSSTLAPVINKIGEELSQNKTWDKVKKDLPKKSIEFNVTSGGSGLGVKSLIEGTSDFGMVSREVSEKEKQKIKDYKEFKLGTDALTISVNPNSPILNITDDISYEQLRNIFSGNYKYWDDLDSSLEHKEIIVVTRDLSGGAHKVFQKIVMGNEDVKDDVIQAPSMGALTQKIITNKYTIGYVSFGLANQNEGKVIPLKVNGVVPTKENIINGSYKISRPLLLIASGNLSDTETIFLNLATSDNGLKVVENLGFIPGK